MSTGDPGGRLEIPACLIGFDYVQDLVQCPGCLSKVRPGEGPYESFCQAVPQFTRHPGRAHDQFSASQQLFQGRGFLAGQLCIRPEVVRTVLRDPVQAPQQRNRTEQRIGVDRAGADLKERSQVTRSDSASHTLPGTGNQIHVPPESSQSSCLTPLKTGHNLEPSLQQLTCQNDADEPCSSNVVGCEEQRPLTAQIEHVPHGMQP